jgi:CBS domain-containing protein
MQPNALPLQPLALEPAIDTHFLTVPPDTPLLDVLVLMSQFRSCVLPGGNLGRDTNVTHPDIEKISCVDQQGEKVFDVADTAGGCVLVMQESRLIGVFTERDIVKLTASGISLGSVKIIDVVSQPPITLQQASAHDVFTALGLFRQHRIRHLPIVDEQGRPVGIVTHDSIRRALQPVNLLTRLRYVKDVMTTQVIHAPVTASVLKLAKLMTEHQVSCVVITQKKGIGEWGRIKSRGSRGSTGSKKDFSYPVSDTEFTIPSPQSLIPTWYCHRARHRAISSTGAGFVADDRTRCDEYTFILS